MRNMERTYKTALELLDNVRRQSRPIAKSAAVFAELQQMPGIKGEPQMTGKPSIHGMKHWLHRLGYSSSDISKLNIIHVAGTKGKGSTCAFVKCFLNAYGERTGFPRKIGLYTSPHLIRPEERIRINFDPLASDDFAKYVWQVHDLLSRNKPVADEGEPRYLQMLALISFHAFIQEGVDAAVYETHHGGQFDATNVVEKPIASVITSLGMDHAVQLGPSLENIAWHKAGIMKKNCPAFSAPQEEGAAEVLRERALEKSTSIEFVGADSSLPKDTIQLKPDVQLINSSVALAASRSFVRQVCPKDTAAISEQDINLAVSRFSWPGRFQIIKEKTDDDKHLSPMTWYLDSAHNEMSVTKAANWFIETSTEPGSTRHILIFSQFSDQRDSPDVFRELARSLSSLRIAHMILSTYELGGGMARTIKIPPTDENLIEAYREIAKSINPSVSVQFQPTITQAIEAARQISKGESKTDILITGSQYLVGGVLQILDPRSVGIDSTRRLQC